MLKIGDKAWYRGAWGRGSRQLVTITGEGEKNGETVYDTDNGHWGYTDQFEVFSQPSLHPLMKEILDIYQKR